ncbi:MAG: GAF domain-containing protein, partial [Cyanobacteria bacterium J06648_11]
MRIVSIQPSTEVDNRQQETLQEYRIPFQAAHSVLLQLVKLAALTFDAPMAAIALADRHTTPVEMGFGLKAQYDALSPLACGGDNVQVIPDARLDRGWSQHPLVTGSPYVRFFASVPLRSPTGIIIGTLAVADRLPRTVADSQIEALVTLGQQAIA